MLFLENLKPLKIYKRPLFLPTVEGDKKKKSAIFLLTPNYESSKALMKSDLLINRLRFASYYIEKDLTYFISSKVMDKVEDVTETYVRNFSEVDFYHSLCEMSAADRNKLKDSSFGLPSKRKYPLHDKSHVKSAIKFFNYVDKEDEAELAKNLNRAINKFYGKEDRPKVGKNNRFSKYYHESTLLESNSFIDHKSDKDLYDWIIKNVEYKSNGIYDVNKIESEHCGDCHDQAGYIYYNLKKLGYKTGRLFMVEYSKWNTPGGKTHTACWYIKNNKYYWMETAWGDMTGIHECGDSLTSVKHLIEKNWSFSGKNDRLFVGTCSGVKDGMSLNEYVNHCTPEKEASNYYHKGRIINSESVEDISSVVNNLILKSENRNDHRTGYKFYLNEDLVGSFDVGDSYKNNNRWLIDFKVEKKYRGQGYGKALCEYAIDNLAVDYLQVLKTNKVALNLYENLGFVEDSVSEDNRYLYMKLDNSIDSVEEGLIFNSKDIYYNKAKFDKGIINLCFITGHSGSGKSTLAKDYKDAEVFCLDQLKYLFNKTPDEVKSQFGDMVYSFYKEYKDRNWNGGDDFDYIVRLNKDFVVYAMMYAEDHKDKRFIIEGVQLYFWFDPDTFEDYAVFIKGTSKLISSYRGFKRNIKNWIGDKRKYGRDLDITFSDELEFNIKYYILSKESTDLEKTIQLWRKYYSKISSISESVVDYKIDKEWYIYDKRGLANACVRVKGYNKPLRGRSEMIVVKGNEIFVDFASGKDQKYQLPGGGWNENEDHKLTAIRETQEEALINVDNVKWYGNYIDYYKEPKDWVKKYFDPVDWWYGYYTELYVGEYKSKYTGKVDKIGKDPIATDGKWYKISDIYDQLRPEHQEALSDYIGTVLESTVEDITSMNFVNTPDTATLTTSALIFDNAGRVLMEDHIKCGAWNFPGGKLNEGEDLSSALCREVHEELSIDITKYHINFDNTFYCEYPVGSGEYRWFKETNYTVDEYKGEIINAEPNKHRSLAWFDINDLIEGKYPLAVAAKCVVNSLKDNNRGSNIPPECTTCTGYTSELETLRKLATPEVYDKVLSSLGLNTYYPKSEDYPLINFVASNRDTVEVTKDNGRTHIDVYVNSISNNRQAEDQYIIALKLMIIGLLKAYKTGLTDAIANSVAEFVLGIYDPNTTCPDLNDFTSNGGTIKDYIDRDCVTKVYEAKTITADSLTRSLKYRTSTKNKIHIGKIRNKTSKLMDSIADSIKIDPPKAPQLPSSNSGSSSNDTSSDENSDEKISESILNSIENEAYIINGDYVTFFEDATNDPYLRKILYKERMVKRKEVMLLLDRVKQDIPEIKYTYVDIDRYQKKNLFVDLYYYNQAFFKNNEFKLRRAYSLYKDLLDRLINDKRIKSAGYIRRTVFIPINDWHKNPSTRMWMYREDINPISIIYDMMVNNPQGLKSLFNGVEVLFFGNNNYFTLDFNDTANSKRNAIKFKNFITKINKGEEFDEEDIDMTQDTPTKDAIKTDIMDKIETSKGVDLTKAADKVKKEEEENKKKRKPQIAVAAKPNVVKAVKKSSTKPTKEEEPEADEDKVISKMTKNKAVKDDTSKEDEELQKAIVRSINVDVDGNTVSDTDDALDIMDDDEYLKDLITGLDSMKDDSVDINKARADRMSKLDRELLDKSLKGRSIREIIGDDTTKDPTRAVDIPKTKLEVASPNKEWEEVSYLNFDKTYDLEHDIVNAFNHFSTVSRPLAIRNIKAEDHSTSEDRLDLYTAEYEDYRGKRYTIKLDIPKIKNNRFLLRGNAKMLQTQFFNMPIIKTDEDVCQIVTNYKKIIISRYNTSSGKSLPNTARLIKCADKYKGNRVKFTGGDNSLVCSKYILPIDYIDLASVFTKIETKDVIIYFNQDEIRKEYEIDDNLGVPYAYSKKSNEIAYYSKDDTTPIVDRILGALMTGPGNVVYDEFWQTYCSMKAPARGMYTRAKIMGSEIPLVVVVAYHDGLSKILSKANINYRLTDKLTKDDRTDLYSDYIRFSDGYLIYHTDYNSSLLLNGLKDCDTLSHSITEIDDKNMYLEFLDNYGGRIKADGLENFYDCEIDPITKETLAYYKLPTEYISVLLYANYLLSDNKYIKHTDTSSRRARRFELIAAYTYQVLSEAYSTYANSIKHNRNSAAFTCKQSAVIDKILLDPTSSDYSVINMLNDIESSNAISTKGLSGLNADRSYSLDKRTYDESMLGIVGISTGFSGNVGITRQATLDSNIQGSRGYVKDTNGDMSKMNSATALTATEAVVPLSTTHDDPIRTAMTFIQTSKHSVRTEVSDPLLVTNGADEALPYMCSDQFAFKAKDDGVIKELTDSGMIVEYKNGEKEYINLTETIEKNSDGGFYVPLKLDADSKLKVGSKIKANQILAYDKYSLSNRAGETDNLAYNVGVLTKVAIINTDDGYEDSGVITELLAQKLIIKIIYKEDCILDKNTNIYNMIEIGSKVEQGDSLLVWQTPYDEEEVNNLLKALANDREALSELGKHTIKSEVTGTVVGIKMYRTVELDELSDSLKSAFKKYEKPISELKKKLKEEDIDASDLPANYPLDATGKLKKAQDSVLIEFYVEYEDIAGVGDKITYNAANKAVIKQVIPLGKEPYTDFRPKEPVTALVSSTSIAKRMVVSTRIYGYLQKLMIELWRSCMDMAEIPYDESEL